MKKLTNKILLSVAAIIIITEITLLSIAIYRYNHVLLPEQRKVENNEIRNIPIRVSKDSTESITVNGDSVVIK